MYTTPTLGQNFQKLKNHRLISALVLILLAITWGSSFILMKRGLKDEQGAPVLQPSQVAALRLSIAGLILLPVSIRALGKVKLNDWKWLAVVGFVGSGIPAILFTVSQQYLDSHVAGILNSLTPLFTLLVGATILKRQVIPTQFMGVMIGLGGAICLIALNGAGSTTNWWFSLLVVIATLCYGLSVNTISAKLTHLHPLHITALSLLIVGIPWAAYLATTNIAEILATNKHGYTSVGYVTILAIFGTCMANILYFWLTQKSGPMFASSVTYMMPLVAIGWGIGDKEPFTVMHLLCCLIMLAGVWLVTRKK